VVKLRPRLRHLPGAIPASPFPQLRQTVAPISRRIESAGVSLVRWFLLCDGRSGICYQDGIPVGPDENLFKDVAAALDVASQSGLRICFSLLIFLVAGPKNPIRFSRRGALQFAGGREASCRKF
jgi:hypothetical protein